MPSHVPSIAKKASRRAGLIGAFAMLGALGALAMTVLSVLAGQARGDENSHIIAHSFYYAAFCIFLSPYGIAMLVQQRRATLAAVKANADPTTIWYLHGFVVSPMKKGAPDPAMSFKVTPEMRMHLTNVARNVPQT